MWYNSKSKQKPKTKSKTQNKTQIKIKPIKNTIKRLKFFKKHKWFGKIFYYNLFSNYAILQFYFLATFRSFLKRIVW